jgi:outer membrane protein assembly factor BamB
MKKYLLFLGVVSAIVFSGCSSKEVFEPASVKDDWAKSFEYGYEIIDTTLNAALLNNREVLDKEGYVNQLSIPENQRLISISDGWIISSAIDGQTTLKFVGDDGLIKTFELKKSVATASIKDDILAVLFADNEMALYKVSNGELILKEQGNAPVVVNSKMANPFFMNGLVLFPTLDGKIVIVNIEQRKKLRTVIVSTEDHFNNVIYFDVVDNKLVLATPNKLMSMSKKEVRAKYEVRSVAYDNDKVYIGTKQGEIISLSSELDEMGKLKFPFAHFLGVIATNDKVYALEKEGYLIEMSKDLLDFEIYEVDIDDGYVFVGDKVFYANDTAITVDEED